MLEKNYLVRLTTELYHLTLLFPKKDPLRYKMRELGDEILAKCLKKEIPKNSLLEDLEILDSFFEIVKSQNWVKTEKVLRLKEQYRQIREKVNEISKKKEEIFENLGNPQNHFFNRSKIRQEKILEILRQKEKVQIWEIQHLFPHVSKRTLRRDFAKLVKEGKVKRIGDKSRTYYSVNC